MEDTPSARRARADLPDLAHDLFIVVFKHLSDYDQSRPVRPWLFGIAFRVVSDYRRSARFARERLGEADDVADRSPPIDEQIAERQARASVMQLLEELDSGLAGGPRDARSRGPPCPGDCGGTDDSRRHGVFAAAPRARGSRRRDQAPSREKGGTTGMSDAPDSSFASSRPFWPRSAGRPIPTAEMQTEVLSRIGGTLGWSGGRGPGAGGSNPAGGPPAGGHLGGGRLVAHGAKHLATGSLARTVATLVVGGVLGSGVHEAYDQVSARRAERARIAAVAPAVPAPTPAPPPAPTPVPEPTVPAGRPAGNPPPRVEHVARGERGEISRARLESRGRARAHRDKRAPPWRAIRAQPRWPRSSGTPATIPRASSRRSARACRSRPVGLGRFDQARRIGAHFHRRFPRSIFAAVVDEALKSIP